MGYYKPFVSNVQVTTPNLPVPEEISSIIPAPVFLSGVRRFPISGTSTSAPMKNNTPLIENTVCSESILQVPRQSHADDHHAHEHRRQHAPDPADKRTFRILREQSIDADVDTWKAQPVVSFQKESQWNAGRPANADRAEGAEDLPQAAFAALLSLILSLRGVRRPAWRRCSSSEATARTICPSPGFPWRQRSQAVKSARQPGQRQRKSLPMSRAGGSPIHNEARPAAPAQSSGPQQPGSWFPAGERTRSA